MSEVESFSEYLRDNGAPDCSEDGCEAVAEAFGMCFWHAEAMVMRETWPDFHDEPLGVWDEPNLPGLRDVY